MTKRKIKNHTKANADNDKSPRFVKNKWCNSYQAINAIDLTQVPLLNNDITDNDLQMSELQALKAYFILGVLGATALAKQY